MADCLNCGQTLGEPRPRYCSACGQETHLQPPRLGEFLQQFGGAYLSTEGALWRTLGLLFFRPGELTRRYLAGRRRHYVLPLRLYLTISVVALLLLRLLGENAVVVEPGALAAPTAATSGAAQAPFIQLGPSASVGLRNGEFYCDNLPAWVCRRLQRRLDIDPKAVAREAEQFEERLLGNLGGAMFLLLPAFAFGLKLVYFNRRRRYAEHLVFALHVHAFWFAALCLTLAQLPWLSRLVLLVVPVYTLLALHRVYGGRLWPGLLRAALLAAFYGLMLVLALGSLVVWTLLF